MSGKAARARCTCDCPCQYWAAPVAADWKTQSCAEDARRGARREDLQQAAATQQASLGSIAIGRLDCGPTTCPAGTYCGQQWGELPRARPTCSRAPACT